MKELFKEMNECKNEIRCLKSIVRYYPAFFRQLNDILFLKVLSEDRFNKRRTTSTGK